MNNKWICVHNFPWSSTIWSHLQWLLFYASDKNQFIQENILTNAAVRWIAIAMNTNSTFTVSYTENPFWYQQFDFRQIRILRGGQSIVDFDVADNFRFYVTTKKVMNFQDDIPSIPINNFKNHYILVFHLTSIQYANKNCRYPELVEEPLKMELNLTFPLQHITEPIVLGERMSLVVVDKFGVFYLKWIIFLSSKHSTVPHYSSIGTVGLFLLTMFQLLTMILLPL